MGLQKTSPAELTGAPRLQRKINDKCRQIKEVRLSSKALCNWTVCIYTIYVDGNMYAGPLGTAFPYKDASNSR